MRVVPLPWGPNAFVVEGEDVDAAMFAPEELRETERFRLMRRRSEWLLSRAAAKRLAVDLGLCSDPRSCRVENRILVVDGLATAWRVSLSHSAPYAGVTISREGAGIDVQTVRPFAFEAAHLFLTEDEIETVLRCSVADRLLHFWCAKEAAWKRHSPRFATLRQVPLQLLEERAGSLRFDDAETVRIGEVVVAVSGLNRTRSTEHRARNNQESD